VADGSTAKGTVKAVELSPLELSHARRVAESKATVPHAYLEAEVELGDAGPSTEAVVRACALALREFPRVNGAYRDGSLELYERVNLGLAVPAEGTLLFPTIFDADAKSEGQIAAEIEELSERARQGEITQPQLSGATFSLADLRPQGIARSSAVVRGGQAAFLSVGATASVLTLSLACDNRILQGPEAAGFLAKLGSLVDAHARPG
jgi:pyruvate dehydrogenase E2 component (dihydrolipoamide acetyltransferase)